jgi:regulator of replication initiation timing
MTEQQDLSTSKKQIVYDMVQAIKEYGINQKQLLFLIKNLVLRIENVELAQKLSEIISLENNQPKTEELPKSSELIEKPKKKSIIVGKSEDKKKSLILTD